MEMRLAEGHRPRHRTCGWPLLTSPLLGLGVQTRRCLHSHIHSTHKGVSREVGCGGRKVLSVWYAAASAAVTLPLPTAGCSVNCPVRRWLTCQAEDEECEVRPQSRGDEEGRLGVLPAGQGHTEGTITHWCWCSMGHRRRRAPRDHTTTRRHDVLIHDTVHHTVCLPYCL